MAIDLLGDPDRGVGGRHAGIDRDHQQDLLDVLRRGAGVAGRPDVHGQLVLVAEGRHSAITSIERVRLSSPGRDQTEPQAPSVMKRWKSASNSVVRACAPSTCASPSTLRRTRHPGVEPFVSQGGSPRRSPASPRRPRRAARHRADGRRPRRRQPRTLGTRLGELGHQSGGVEPSWSPTMHRVGTATARAAAVGRRRGSRRSSRDSPRPAYG